MQKFVDLLDALAESAGSDRKAAAALGVAQNAFSMWRRGLTFPEDQQAERIAAALKLDPAYVFAIVRVARAKSQTARATWQRIAEQFGKAATLAAFAVGIGAAPSPAPAQSASAPPLCIMSTRRRRFLTARSALASTLRAALGARTHSPA